jgi:hypothetical protein
MLVLGRWSVDALVVEEVTMATKPPRNDHSVRLGARRRPKWLLAFVVFAACVAVAATMSSGSASASKRVRTIHIVTTLTSSSVNSAGLGGPGDVLAQVFTFKVSPSVTGHIDASSTIVSATEQLSHVAFVFPDGQIDAQAGITLPPTQFTAAVLGGTLAYEGVGGQVVNVVISRSPLTIDRTIYLIYPHKGDD